MYVNNHKPYVRLAKNSDYLYYLKLRNIDLREKWKKAYVLVERHGSIIDIAPCKDNFRNTYTPGKSKHKNFNKWCNLRKY